MKVVSDTSPLNYLVLVDAIGVIPELYSRLYMPPAVLEELEAEGSPPPVRTWATHLPDWVCVQTPRHTLDHPRLHRGEGEAIALAREIGAKLLLIDERMGRVVAVQQGLQTLGVLGVLDLAASRRLIDLPVLLDRLMQTNFRISRELLAELLRREARRRDGSS
jgi:predicted nucleic acid-binding protein